MEKYREFVEKLQIGFQTFISTPKDIWKTTAIKYVNGLAADELRRLINIETRREYGAFFTDSLLAKKVLLDLKPKFNNKIFVYDPACGAGNLLLAIVEFITSSHPEMDLKQCLFGTDIHKEFVEATKLRLSINDVLKTTSVTLTKERSSQYKNNILTADGLEKNSFYEQATHIIVNPPFNAINSNGDIDWAKGKVSAAAVFIDKIIQNVNVGVSIIAILPDVLRSGSRYEKWRLMVNRECVVEKIKLLGQFDKFADIDVFAIKLSKRPRKSNRPSPQFEPQKKEKTKTIGDLFDVCVGPVVDNRDPAVGKSLGYVVSKGLLGWEELKVIPLKRMHQGKSFSGPFVVIKRTSRMGDSYRAIATIINTSSPVYVDNHLIILKPKSGKLTDCKKILTILKDKKTDNWIDSQIRCRHLTVKVVSQIPVWEPNC